MPQCPAAEDGTLTLTSEIFAEPSLSVFLVLFERKK